jgi:copper(I)-binding protein
MTVVSLMHRRSQVPRSQRRLSRTGGIALAAVAGFALLTGCAAGKHAQTVNQQPAIDGVSADDGAIGIRNAGVLPPATNNYAKGSSANLQLVVVNNGTADDKLVSVTSPVASSAVLGLTGPVAPSDAGGPAATLSGSSSGSGSESSSASGSASSSTSGSASSSASGSASSSASGSASSSASGTTGSASSSPTASPTQGSSSAAGGAGSQIPIPANGSVQIGYSSIGPAITLVGLNTILYPSQTVQVTFTFASGATIDAQLAVKLTSGGAEAPTLQVSPSEAS